MITKLKVCLIGATGVGKSSLVARFVHSMFSDRYRTTIGVAIDRCDVQRGPRTAHLVVWDLSGEDEFQNVQSAYLRGAAGYILVVDGTRPETLDTAKHLQVRVRDAIGTVPFVVAVNKADLAAQWQVDERELQKLAPEARMVKRTSAKTGAGVKELFHELVDSIQSEEVAWT